MGLAPPCLARAVSREAAVTCREITDHPKRENRFCLESLSKCISNWAGRPTAHLLATFQLAFPGSVRGTSWVSNPICVGVHAFGPDAHPNGFSFASWLFHPERQDRGYERSCLEPPNTVPRR